LKIIYRILLAVALILALAGGMFYADSGREVLMSMVSRYFLAKNLIFKINGMDRKISRIQEIFIRFPEGFELIFSDITLKRKKFCERSSIHVSNFTLNGSEEKIDLNEKLKGLIPLMRALRIFINDLSLGSGFMRIAGKTYSLDDLTYRSDLKDDFLYSKINRHQSLNVLFHWENGECTKSNIAFEKILDFDGNLFINGPEKKVAVYELTARNGAVEIISNGQYRDFMLDIKIQNASVKYGGKNYACRGNVCLGDQRAKMQAKIFLEDLPNFDLIPEIVRKNFENVHAHLRLSYDFSENPQQEANVVFQRIKQNLGGVKYLQKNQKSIIDGTIGWVNIAGFALRNFKCEIEDFQKAKINLWGDDFEIISDLKIGDQISVENAKLLSKKGWVESSGPFLLAENLDCSLNFNFSQMDFWNKIVPISGSGSGSFSYKSKEIVSKGEFKALNFGLHELGAVKYDLAPQKNKITLGNAKIFNINFDKLELNFSKGKLALVGKVNDVYSLDAHGDISGSFDKISLEKCRLTSPQNKIALTTCSLDFVNNDYKVDCQFSGSSPKKTGFINFSLNSRGIDFAFRAVPINSLANLFNHWAPNCELDGSLKLKAENGILFGSGDFLLSSLMARRNLLKVSAKISEDGAKIFASLKNRNDEITADAFLPAIFTTSGPIVKNTLNRLSCSVRGSAQLERLLELPDNADVRGAFDCDFHLSGSLANPSIGGNARLRRAHIAVGDVFLRNGNISLGADGKSIRILSAEFVDVNKKRLFITGTGVPFFRGIVPNIKTDLRLRFDNFMLFDSDDTQITVRGEGAMRGPIDDMRISGRVNIPKCELRYFDSSDVAKDRDVLVENDPFLHNPQKKKSQEKDFFSYDVHMNCPRINFSGNIFEMILSSNDLLLSSHQDRATLVGTLKLSGGKLDLFGKRMPFTKGSAIFRKEFPFEPDAFFSCKRNFGDISVSLDIGSTPERGSYLNLYSNPSYTKDVILAKMIFGKELKYLSIGEVAQLANAVASLKQRGYIFSLLNTFQNVGIVDNISFTSGENQSSSLYSDSQNSGSSQRRVNMSAGKYIHDNIYLSVNKKEEGASFDVDLSITPRVSIKANTNGEAGISWKYRY
jgi:hypothetical protein